MRLAARHKRRCRRRKPISKLIARQQKKVYRQRPRQWRRKLFAACCNRRERGNKVKISYRIIPGILLATLLMGGVSQARSAQDHPAATEQDAKSTAVPDAAKEHGPEAAQET